MRSNALEPVQTRDLLDQVLLDLDVEPVRGRLYGKDIRFQCEWEVQMLERPGHVLRRNGDAQHLLRARRAHAHRLSFRKLLDQILRGAGLAAADVEDQA